MVLKVLLLLTMLVLSTASALHWTTDASWGFCLGVVLLVSSIQFIGLGLAYLLLAKGVVK